MISSINLRLSLDGIFRPDGRQCLGSPSRPTRPSAGHLSRAKAGTLYARLSSGGSTRALAMSGGGRNTRLVVCAAEKPPKAAESATPWVKKRKTSSGTASVSEGEDGILAPFVIMAKKVLGEPELKQIRAKVIKEHSEVMNTFVDTADSKFGDYVLRVLFKLADTNKNGTIDEEELHVALKALGFEFLEEKEIKKIFAKSDKDKNGELDFEEWKNSVPKNLKMNLKKLAKENGHELGFLV